MLLGLLAEPERVVAISRLCAESQPRSAALRSNVRIRLFALPSTLSVWEAEEPPPGAGFEIATWTVPTAETALAGIKTEAVLLEGYEIRLSSYAIDQHRCSRDKTTASECKSKARRASRDRTWRYAIEDWHRVYDLECEPVGWIIL